MRRMHRRRGGGGPVNLDQDFSPHSFIFTPSSSAMFVPSLVLWTLVLEISSQVSTTSNRADPPLLSPRYYQYIDPDSGTRLVCDKCPAGTHVSAHCSSTSVRECAPCPAGTFTGGENGVVQCHRCQTPCPAGLVEEVPCTATRDRMCICPPGRFLSGEGGTECTPHSMCPPGTRVRKRGSGTEDVLCKPCTKGTFSRVESRALKCQAHSDCQAQGLMLLTVGTRETDNVCGPPTAANSSSLPLGQHLATSLKDHKGSNSRSAAIQQMKNKDGKPERTHPSPDIRTIPPTLHPSPTLPCTAGTQLVAATHRWDQTNADSLLGPRKKTVEVLEGSEVRSGKGVSKMAVRFNRDGGGWVSNYNRSTRRGSPRPSSQDNFDINEHLPWMIVLLLLLVLVLIVACSVSQSSRVLKKGPVQDPSSIIEKGLGKKAPAHPVQVKEKWMYYSNGQGVDILKLVAAQVGPQWIDIYQLLANATEREVAAFSNGYSADHERAYAALQHWTIRDRDANLAKLINALHRHRRIDVVEKIRLVMEDNPQFDLKQLMTSANGSQSLSPIHKQPLRSPGSGATGVLEQSPGSGAGGALEQSPGSGATGVLDHSPVDRTKSFFHDESEPLLRCDSTSSKDSALSRNGSFITKEKKDTVLRQVRLDPCDLQPIFDDMLHILNPDELHIIERLPAAEDRLDQLFEIAGVKSQEASQTLLDSVYSHFPDLL
ncbi:tumor necrosis factor receptor superfamily member 21 [Nerophis ophidion]|uniref:tumor necrosis factor receptor superfamily member 21 n=1 Tax=Nerophis ophidion TaxID=159077 RepID=UPI002AE04EA7|nr:tumor necrosis factor receptor superfamily member 21 [Nerophis ophidion]